MKVLVINGPNLNLLGERSPGVYGKDTLDAINTELRKKANSIGINADFFQSNSEGGIVDKIHAARTEYAGIVINAGAYTHYSYAIRDAVEAVKIPCVEVHMSNVYAREEFRSKSVISCVCAGSISGFGKNSYYLALLAVKDIVGEI